MEPFSKRHCSFLYALAEYYVKQFPKDRHVFFDEFGANRYRYLPRVAARLRMSMEISAHRDKTMPTGEVIDDSVRTRAQPRLEYRAFLSRFLKGSAKRPGLVSRAHRPSRLDKEAWSTGRRQNGRSAAGQRNPNNKSSSEKNTAPLGFPITAAPA
jgi:hypothetical protein